MLLRRVDSARRQGWWSGANQWRHGLVLAILSTTLLPLQLLRPRPRTLPLLPTPLEPMQLLIAFHSRLRLSASTFRTV